MRTSSTKSRKLAGMLRTCEPDQGPHSRRFRFGEPPCSRGAPATTWRPICTQTPEDLVECCDGPQISAEL